MLNKVIRSGLHTLAVALAVRMQSSRIPVRRAQPVSTKATAEERLAKISSLKTRLKEIENITFTQPTYSSPNTFNDPIDLQLSTLEAVVEDPLKSDINYINNIHGDDEDDFVVFDKEFDKIDDSSAAHESDQHGRCSNVLDARVFTGLLDKEIRQLNEKAETILQRTRNIMCEMDKSGNEIVSSSSSKREYYDLSKLSGAQQPNTDIEVLKMKYLQIATDTDEPKLTNVDSSNNDTFAIDSIAVGCDEGRLGDKYAELIRRLEQAKSKIVDIDRVLKTR